MPVPSPNMKAIFEAECDELATVFETYIPEGATHVLDGEGNSRPKEEVLAEIRGSWKDAARCYGWSEQDIKAMEALS